VKTNTKPTTDHLPRTHEGALAKRITPEQALRRSVMACMLFEDTFYEEGEEIAVRIKRLVNDVPLDTVLKLAVEARTAMKLRHLPLWLVAAAVARVNEERKRGPVALYPSAISRTLRDVIQRPDEITEFMALYWRGGRVPLAHSVKRGLAMAFEKFDEYALAKYDRDEKIRLRDVLFLVHGKTKDIALARQSYSPADAHGNVVFAPPLDKPGYHRGKVRRHGESLAEKIVTRTLATPDTWEVKLTEAKTAEQKREVWRGLLERKHLGALALLRNLRNMQQAGVPVETVRTALANMKVERVLPFRFLTAARHAPQLEPELEQAMFRCLAEQERLAGQTVLIVDVSGSMNAGLSSKSEVTRIDAACGLAILLREVCEDVTVVAFSHHAAQIPARRGMALRDAINASMPHGSTNTQTALTYAASLCPAPDRVILITDEQSHQTIGSPHGKAGYVINVGADRNGIGYGPWLHVDGWSEAVVDYLRTLENETGA
jgi:hypothetical protein